MAGISDPEVNDAVSRRWRLRAGVITAVMGLFALVALASAVAYDESLATPACLLAGTLAMLASWGSVPLGVTTEDRRSMGVSAAWAVASGLLYFGGPFLMAALGLE